MGKESWGAKRGIDGVVLEQAGKEGYRDGLLELHSELNAS